MRRVLRRRLGIEVGDGCVGFGLGHSSKLRVQGSRFWAEWLNKRGFDAHSGMGNCREYKKGLHFRGSGGLSKYVKGLLYGL